MATPETVRVYTVDENDDALEGVLVRFFDDVDAFVTQNYSSLVGSDAYAEVTLDGDATPISYSVRLSKTGVAFDGTLGDDSATPQSIDIYSPASLAPSATNDFQVQGQTFSLPVATDPRLCRASGFFKDASGAPLANADLHFRLQRNPLLVDGYGILGLHLYGTTDSSGYFEVDLYRDGEYLVELQSLEHQRCVVVPDASAVNLVSLLFPVVASVAYDPTAVSVAAGDSETVAVTVTDSTGITHDLTDSLLTFTSSDTAIATVAILSGELVVTGVAAGAATVTAEQADTSIVTLPPVTLDSLSVTVS
jgi:uncharacterized protein YjdB